MMKIYLLTHVYDSEESSEEYKLLGIYSSKSKAIEAQEVYKNLDGFKSYPDGFQIDEYELDKNYWQEGFITKR